MGHPLSTGAVRCGAAACRFGPEIWRASRASGPATLPGGGWGEIVRWAVVVTTSRVASGDACPGWLRAGRLDSARQRVAKDGDVCLLI